MNRRARAALLLLCLALWVAAVSISFAEVPANAAIYRIQLRTEAQRVWRLDAPIPVLAAQVQQESAWRPAVTAWDGGQGFAQFMPATLRWACAKFKPDLAGEPCDAYRPRVAFRLQAAYMKHLYAGVGKFDDACSRIGFALMDYNSGAGWRVKRQARSRAPGDVWVTRSINPGVTAANQRVAEDYPVRVLRLYTPRYVAAGWGRGVCA